MMFTYFTTKRPLSHLNNENVRKISLWLELILLKTKNYFSISFSFDHRSDHAVESTTSKKKSVGYFVANWNACPTQKYYTWKFSTQISSAKWCEKIQIIVCLLASVNGSSHYDVSSTLKCRLIERERERRKTRENEDRNDFIVDIRFVMEKPLPCRVDGVEYFDYGIQSIQFGLQCIQPINCFRISCGWLSEKPRSRWSWASFHH